MPPVCSILQYNKEPSQALTIAAFWTRLLVETGAASKEGHVIGEHLRFRKTQTCGSTIISAIEIQQLQGDPTLAQRYLRAHTWWLYRSPFGVQRLPVRLMVHSCTGMLVNVEGWNVTSLDLSMMQNLTDLADVASAFIHVKTLNISGTSVSKICSLHDMVSLTSLNARDCNQLRDLGPLHVCQCLEELDITNTGISDITALFGMVSLQKLRAYGYDELSDLSALAQCSHLKELDVSSTAVSNLSALQGLAYLEVLRIDGCEQISDLSPIQECSRLRELHAGFTSISTLSALHCMACLEVLDIVGCEQISDLSPVQECFHLRELYARYTPISTLTPLRDMIYLEVLDLDGCVQVQDLSPLLGCCQLTKLRIQGTTIADLSSLAGMQFLECIDAEHSKMTNINGLDTCPKLTTLLLCGTAMQDYKLPSHGISPAL